MALELSIPASEDPAGIPAETSLQAVQNLLAGLPFGKPVGAAQSVLVPLQLLNRRNVVSELRFKLLELYRPAVLSIVQGLAAQYYNVALPLPDKAKEAAQLVRALFTELAYGYKLSLIGRSSGLFGGNKLLPVMIQRVMGALSQLLVVSYQTYAPTPKTVWSELHRLYLFAAQQKLLNTDVADSDGNTTSINLVYKQALLLFLADPRHLAPGDVDRARDYLARHAGLGQLQPLAPQAGAAGVFLVRLTVDEPPTAFVRRKETTDARADILLVATELTALLAIQMARLQENEAPKNLGLPPIALDPRYQDMLAHLHKHWVHAPKRAFSRSTRQDTTSLCIGLHDAHYFLNGESRYVFPSVDDTGVTEITLSSAAASASAEGYATCVSTRWRVVNESAGGLALAKMPDTPASLRLGELIGLRTDHAARWGLGVVRWASLGERGDLDIGAQMIAPDAVPVVVRADGNDRFELALLLPQMAALKQPGTLIMAPGGYGPARVLEMDDHGKSSRLLATKLIERTNCFERFQFSYL